MSLPNGTRLGPYELLAQVGAGGMGQVYRARDTRLGREVAVKVLLDRQNDDVMHERFLREARAASALNHPNIVSIFDIGPGRDSPYIVMELVAGESLRTRLRHGSLPLHQALAIASQIADALDCAHLAGCVHRDLKPENIMLTREDRVKIVDFGLAKPTPVASGGGQEGTVMTMLTMAGVVLGTPTYMSPEQARGQQVGPASDQFSLGTMLYEMISGVQPFRRDSVAETMAAVITSEAPALSASVPYGVAVVIGRAISKDPLLRYPSCRELKLALDHLSAAIGSGSFAPTITVLATPSGATSTKSSRPTAAVSLPAIAVLPFVDLSPEQDQAYFCDGIAEETINALSHVPGLRVVSRGSSFRFHGGDYDLSELARKLKVDSVLEGRVRKVGDRLRITAQLVAVENGFSIWSERFDGQMKDVFGIQDEISAAIVASLKLKLAERKREEIKRRYTENVEAYNAYLKGRYAWNKRTPAGIRAAMAHFEQALANDPEYALAWAGVADCCIVPSYYGYADPRQLMPRGKAAALRALEIDPDLAEGHATLGMITGLYEYKWLEAEGHFKRALEINPNLAMARMWYACHNLAPMGRLEEAAKEAQRAAGIDPLNQSVCSVVGMIDYWSRRYAQAIPALRNVIEMDPNFPIAHLYLALSLHAAGRTEEAFDYCRKAIAATDNSPVCLAILGYFHGIEGETAQARGVLEDLKRASQKSYVSGHSTALVHIGMGDLDSAFEALGRGTDEHSSILVWIMSEPMCDRLRSDSRYPALLRRMGFVGEANAGQETVPNAGSDQFSATSL